MFILFSSSEVKQQVFLSQVRVESVWKADNVCFIAEMGRGMQQDRSRSHMIFQRTLMLGHLFLNRGKVTPNRQVHNALCMSFLYVVCNFPHNLMQTPGIFIFKDSVFKNHLNSAWFHFQPLSYIKCMKWNRLTQIRILYHSNVMSRVFISQFPLIYAALLSWVRAAAR